MITFIIISIVIVLFALNILRLNGIFGLHIEVNIERRRIYGWYRGEVLQSDSFSLNEPIENIQSKRRNLELACKEQVKKIKILESKLWEQ